MQRMILTLYNMYDDENTLFDDFVLPEKVNREDFLTRLMVECGELEVSLTRPAILKRAIGSWSRGRLPMWNRIGDIQDFEYNPIWNVDGTVQHTGSNTNDRTYGRNRSGNLNESYEEHRDETVESTSQLAADNVESWSNDNKTVTDTDTDVNGNRYTTENEKINDTDNSVGSDSYTDVRTGNIGVTTTQQMMREEKEFWENYDLYGIIIKEFSHEFLLLVF